MSADATDALARAIVDGWPYEKDVGADSRLAHKSARGVADALAALGYEVRPIVEHYGQAEQVYDNAASGAPIEQAAEAADALARALADTFPEPWADHVQHFADNLAALGYEVRPIEQAAEAAVGEHAPEGLDPPRGLRVTNGGDRFTPPSAAADPPALWHHSNLPPEDDRYCVDCAADLNVEALRIREGWPTPISMRRAADALDVLVIPRFGAILRWVADLCDNDPAAHAAAREAAK